MTNHITIDTLPECVHALTGTAPTPIKYTANFQDPELDKPALVNTFTDVDITLGYAKHGDGGAVTFHITHASATGADVGEHLMFEDMSLTNYEFEHQPHYSYSPTLSQHPQFDELIDWLSEVAANTWSVREQTEYDLFNSVEHNVCAALSTHYFNQAETATERP